MIVMIHFIFDCSAMMTIGSLELVNYVVQRMVNGVMMRLLVNVSFCIVFFVQSFDWHSLISFCILYNRRSDYM